MVIEKSFRIITFVNEEKFPGVLKKYSAIKEALLPMTSVSHINVSKFSIIGLGQFSRSLISSRHCIVLLRAPTHIMFFAGLVTIIARLNKVEIHLEIPTPLSSVVNEKTNISKFGPVRFFQLMPFYIGAFIAALCSSRIYQYATDSSFVARLFNKRQRLISNGISRNLINSQYISDWNRSSDHLEIIMVASFNFWHGADRLIKSLSHTQKKITLHLVGGGAIVEDLKNLTQEYDLGDRVKFYGYQDKLFIKSLYEKMDIGVSSVGIFRKRLTHASDLKTREYMSSGLPVILSHTDIDISNKNLPFVYQVANENTIIDLDRIYAWYFEMCATKDSKYKIIDFVKKNLTYDKKVNEFLS